MFIDVNKYAHCLCDSDMIQAALDEASATGAAVVIPKRNQRTGRDIWEISKTVYVYSESIVILQNCHLRQVDGTFCHIFANSGAKNDSPVTQRNIHILGMGKAVLDGGEHNGVFEENGISRKVTKPTEHKALENRMLAFRNVENLVIENLTVKDQRYWGINLLGVAYSRVSNICFSSSSNVPNQDGLSILKGCHDIIMENITGCVGDNLIAICALGIIPEWEGNGDIYNITVRNVMGYGVGGCALIRILNHDGYKIYNVRMDNIIETSPWSENDAVAAPNPDLAVTTDEKGNIILPEKKLIPGEQGYRIPSAIVIGDSYWYKNKPAVHGETYGISVSNVMTHARNAIMISNTLLDSSFDRIRLFGNGFRAVCFTEGQVENLRFSQISFDRDCRPLRVEREEQGNTCIYFQGTKLENVLFQDLHCPPGRQNVFSGNGQGKVTCGHIDRGDIPVLSSAEGIVFQTVGD